MTKLGMAAALDEAVIKAENRLRSMFGFTDENVCIAFQIFANRLGFDENDLRFAFCEKHECSPEEWYRKHHKLAASPAKSSRVNYDAFDRCVDAIFSRLSQLIDSSRVPFIVTEESKSFGVKEDDVRRTFYQRYSFTPEQKYLKLKTNFGSAFYERRESYDRGGRRSTHSMFYDVDNVPFQPVETKKDRAWKRLTELVQFANQSPAKRLIFKNNLFIIKDNDVNT